MLHIYFSCALSLEWFFFDWCFLGFLSSVWLHFVKLGFCQILSCFSLSTGIARPCSSHDFLYSYILRHLRASTSVLTNEHSFGASCMTVFHLLMPLGIFPEKIMGRKRKRSTIVLSPCLLINRARLSKNVLTACSGATFQLPPFSLKNPVNDGWVDSHLLIFTNTPVFFAFLKSLSFASIPSPFYFSLS